VELQQFTKFELQRYIAKSFGGLSMLEALDHGEEAFGQVMGTAVTNIRL
jgi:hypothetical protein